MRNSGFSVLELVIALALACGVAVVVLMLFLTGIRFYTAQLEHVRIDADLRTAMVIFNRELQGLDATDGDIVAADTSSITYRALRNVQFACRIPDLERSEIVVWDTLSYGIRNLDPGRDSILVFAEGDPTTRLDNVWLNAAVRGTAPGRCPGGVPGVAIKVSGMSVVSLSNVASGAPVLGFHLTRIRSYKDGRNKTWIGVQEANGADGWHTTQPLLGPIADRGGLRFEYFDAFGAATTTTRAIAGISVTVVDPGLPKTGLNTESASETSDSLKMEIALRNNPRL